MWNSQHSLCLIPFFRCGEVRHCTASRLLKGTVGYEDCLFSERANMRTLNEMDLESTTLDGTSLFIRLNWKSVDVISPHVYSLDFGLPVATTVIRCLV